MTKPSVYIETSIVSYLTARPSRDLIIAAQQAMTRDWWRDAPERFVLLASELVFTEAAAGDADAARARLTALEMVTRLDTTEDAAAPDSEAAGTRGVSARGGGGCSARRHCRCEQRRLPADVGISATSRMPPYGRGSSERAARPATSRRSFARPMNSWRSMTKQTKPPDPIIAEVRAIRQAYAARFDYDVEAIFRGHSSQTGGLRTRLRAVARAARAHGCRESDDALTRRSSAQRRRSAGRPPTLATHVHEADDRGHKRERLLEEGEICSIDHSIQIRW